MQLPLKLLYPAPVLPRLGGTRRPWIAETCDRVLLPRFELGRIQPLILSVKSRSSTMLWDISA
jgi:hypothetical protein